MMDARAFTSIATFLKLHSGLALTPDKAYLVASRLKPVAEHHGLKSLEELAGRLIAPPIALKRDVIEAMTTNETSFFRDVTPFEKFKTVVLNELVERRAARRALRILCAAASSGQEPYSLAMCIAEQGSRLAGWNIDILGVDLDSRVLKRAEEGLYTQFEAQRGLPVHYLVKYFTQEQQSWRLKPVIRDMVKFRQCNLLEPLVGLGNFDVVFCRNVLIYFDTPTKTSVLDRLADQIASDGYLFLGGAETVLDITTRFTPSPEHRGIYRPKSPTNVTRAA